MCGCVWSRLRWARLRVIALALALKRVCACLFEEGLEHLGAVVEDAADVGGDEERVDEGAAEDGVVDVVGDFGAIILCDEAMFVAPETIWAAELFVDETVRWFPGGDFALPGNWEAVEAEFVADAGAGMHGDGRGRDDVKFEEYGSEALEIAGVGEEGEDFGDGAGEEDGAVDGESFHVDKMNTENRRARMNGNSMRIVTCESQLPWLPPVSSRTMLLTKFLASPKSMRVLSR